MSCCGKKRAQFYGAMPMGPAPGPVRQVATPQGRPSAPVPVLFEYQGATAVSAIGPVTRRLYRFAAPHARVAVDARDAPAMTAVPSLRRVR
jgi:hypothetical protein